MSADCGSRIHSWSRVAALTCALGCLIAGCSSGSTSAATSAAATASSGPGSSQNQTPESSPAPAPTSASAAMTAPASAPPAVASPTASDSAPVSAAASASDLPSGWVDQQISFEVDGTRVYGTFRHPSGTGPSVPAALLIAGSGPTDRNGNSAVAEGDFNTLSNLAQVLATNHVASLRYDKLGSGKTGLGAAAADPDAIDLKVFTDEAQAALAYLVARPGVQRDRVSVIGHSEGALFALLLATDADSAKSVHAVGLLEPLSQRYLDLIQQQVSGQLRQQQQSKVISAALAQRVSSTLTKAISQLRTEGTVPPDLPGGLENLFVPSSLKFLRQADRIDPAQLAAKLPKTTPVLISCSDADIQVSCADVARVAAGVKDVDLVRLTGVDHILKQDASKTGANYGAALPFSTQLTAAVRTWVKKWTTR